MCANRSDKKAKVHLIFEKKKVDTVCNAKYLHSGKKKFSNLVQQSGKAERNFLHNEIIEREIS